MVGAARHPLVEFVHYSHQLRTALSLGCALGRPTARDVADHRRSERAPVR
jgi:hypothetical protein